MKEATISRDKLNFDLTSYGKKRRVEGSTLAIIGFTVGMFALVIGIILYAFYTRNRESNFLRQIGVNLTGDLEIYSSNQGNNMLLCDANSGLLTKAILVGHVRSKRKSDVINDKQIIITSVTNDEERLHRYVYIDSINDGEAMVTVVNENGSMTVVLTQTKYSSFFKYITEETNYGKNHPVP